jgi:hypothetical protein
VKRWRAQAAVDEGASVKSKKELTPRLHFASIPLAVAANRRKGKHYKMISQILSDLDKLDDYSALKVNLSDTGIKKADLRSALHRAAKKKMVDLATTSDDKYFYVFHRPSQRLNTA